MRLAYIVIGTEELCGLLGRQGAHLDWQRLGLCRSPCLPLRMRPADGSQDYANWKADDVPFHVVARCLKLPPDATVVDWSPHVRFMNHEVIFKVSHPDLADLHKASCLPEIAAQRDAAGALLGWGFPSVFRATA